MGTRLRGFLCTLGRLVLLVARIALGVVRMAWVIATFIPAATLAMLAHFGGAKSDDVRKLFYPWTKWDWRVGEW